MLYDTRILHAYNFIYSQCSNILLTFQCPTFQRSTFRGHKEQTFGRGGHFAFAVLQCSSKCCFRANLTIEKSIAYFWAWPFRIAYPQSTHSMSWANQPIPCPGCKTVFFSFLNKFFQVFFSVQRSMNDCYAKFNRVLHKEPLKKTYKVCIN